MRFFFSILISIAILSTAFYSCSNSQATPPPPDPQTELLKSYLQFNFGDSIVTANHLYILIAKKDARENIAAILEKIRPRLFLKNPTSYSTIISVDMPIADSLLPAGKVKTDWDGAIDKLKLPLSGVTLIQTAENKFVKLLPLTVENADQENMIAN